MHYIGPLISVFGVFSVFYFTIPLSHRILDPWWTMKTSILGVSDFVSGLERCNNIGQLEGNELE